MKRLKYIAAALIFPLLIAGLMAGSPPDTQAQANAESSNLAFFAALMQYIRSQPTPSDVDAELLPALAQLDAVFVDIYAEGFIAPFTGETPAEAKVRIETLPTEDRYTAAMVESYHLASDTFLLDVMHILLASYYVNYFTTADLAGANEFLGKTEIQGLANAFDHTDYAIPAPSTAPGTSVPTPSTRTAEEVESSNLASFAALMQYIRSRPTPDDVDAELLPALAQLDAVFVDIYAEGFIAPFTGETAAEVKARIESIPAEDRYIAAMVESYRLASDTFLLDVMHILLASYYVNYFTTSDLAGANEFLGKAEIQGLADAFDPTDYAVAMPAATEPEDMDTPESVGMDLPAGWSGFLTHPGGARIEIPEGTTDEAVMVEIAEVPAPDYEGPELAGGVFDFNVGDDRLNGPVTLQIPYEPREGQDPSAIVALSWNEETRSWEEIGGVADEDTGLVEVTVSELPPKSTQDTSDGSSRGAAEIGSCDVSQSEPSLASVFEIVVQVRNNEVSNPLYMEFKVRDGLFDDKRTFYAQTATPFVLPQGMTSTLTYKVWSMRPGELQIECALREDRQGLFGLTGYPDKTHDAETVTMTVRPGPFRGNDLSDAVDSFTCRVSQPAGSEKYKFEATLKTKPIAELPPELSNRTIDNPSIEVYVVQNGHGRKKRNIEKFSDIAFAFEPSGKEISFDDEHSLKDGDYTAYFTFWSEPAGTGFDDRTGFEDKPDALVIHSAEYDGSTTTSFHRSPQTSPLPEQMGFIVGCARDFAIPIESDIAGDCLQRTSLDAGIGRRVTLVDGESSHPVFTSFPPGPSVALPVDTDPTCERPTNENSPPTTGTSPPTSSARPPASEVSALASLPFGGTMRVLQNQEVSIPVRLTNDGDVESEFYVKVRLMRGSLPYEYLTILGTATESLGAGKSTTLYFPLAHGSTGAYGLAVDVHTGSESGSLLLQDRFADRIEVVASRGTESSDRAALVALYNSTGGASWRFSSNWLSNLPVGLWYGVETNSDNRVVGLYLEDNRLRGRIPSELGDLAELKTLALYSDPDESAAVNLNRLSGPIPSSLGNLSKLEWLELDGNELSGSIPSSLGNLSNLVGLSLWGNELSGSIPSSLGNLSNLEVLYLDNNELSGSIPSSLGNLSSLEELSLWSNELSGSIPSYLGNLSNLEVLYLDDNGLSGSIPLTLGSLSGLEWLYLSGNELSGCIPEDLRDIPYNDLAALELPFCDAVAGSPGRAALVALYNSTDGPNWATSTNWLSDRPIAEWYGVSARNGRVTGLYLDDNRLSGVIPSSLGNLSNLEVLHLYSWATVCGAEKSGNWSCRLNSPTPNRLSGPIPPELGNLSNLRRLWLGHNQLSGPIPPELGNLSNLEYLDLGDNQLVGPIPPELGNLSNLEYLHLSINQLSGPIPFELGNLSKLGYLFLSANQLSGPILPELGNLSNLSWLSLGSNQLSGPIPPELGSLSNLESLNLRHNQLSGPIPPELGSLSKLGYLHLNDNQLSGPIPPELGNLSNLYWVEFGGNQFTGCIPLALRNVRDDLDDELGLSFCAQ